MAVEKTQCIPPARHDGFAGEAAAVWRSLVRGFVAGLVTTAAIWALAPMAMQDFAVILSGVAGGTVFIFVGGDAFLDWWLNRRLLCLGGDRFAVGIVWTVEPPDKKGGLEWFDDDYSINVILSPLGPGDQVPDDAGSMWELVHHHGSIAQAGLPTFGAGPVAARTGWRARWVVSPIFKEDPGALPVAPNDHWEATPSRDELPVPAFREAWQLEDDSLFDTRLRTEVPDTQLLHVEFEGTTLFNLRRWLPVIAIIAVINAGGIAGTLAAGGVLGSVLAPAAAAFVIAAMTAFFLAFLAAILIRLLSHHGNPANANVSDRSDRNAGNVRDIQRPDTRETATAAPRWDAVYDLIGVMGRWVYDFGHSRGWNELHPVKHAQLLTSEGFDAQLQAAGKSPVRPANKDQANALLKIFESGVQQAMQVTPDQQQAASFAVHPNVG